MGQNETIQTGRPVRASQRSEPDVCLDPSVTACRDMRHAVHQFADAYEKMHAAIVEMDAAWQRMSDGLGRVSYGRESAAMRTRARLRQDHSLESINRYTSLKKLLDQGGK